MKKRILCFGDSNTWGYMVTGGRFDEDVRWPMRLQTLLGEDFRVIEEGFNGRTCVFDDPVEGGYKSGLDYLPACVMSHSPLDLVIIMLGTNDMKKRFGMTAFTIGGAVTQLVKAARAHALDASGVPPKILIICPPPVMENVMETRHGPIFGEESVSISKALPHELRRVAKLQRCEFMDAALYADVTPLDAIHMTREGHLRLAQAICEKVKEIL